MNCKNENDMNYILGQGLLDQITLAGYEAKTPDEALKARAAEVAAMPFGEQKLAAAAKVYGEFLELPITAMRTQDPVLPEAIEQWCPILLSPYTYELPADIGERISAAKAAIAALPCTKVFDAAAAFADSHGEDFTRRQVLDYLAERIDSCSCAQRRAVQNLRDGVDEAECAANMNPYRAGADSLMIGAAFGLKYVGRPEIAAKTAMRYAIASHYKGGVYAAMWLAAMLAHAAVISDPEVFTVRSLSCIPIPSPYFRAVALMQRHLNCSVDRDGCLEDLHKYCDAGDDFIVRNAYPNSMAIAAALLYGHGDVANSLDAVEKAGYQVEKNRALTLAILALANGVACVAPYLK